MAANHTFGHIQEFQPDSDSITAYIERMNLFFVANDVPNEKKVAVFLSVIGGKTYTLLRSLLSPQLPQSKSYSELVDSLKRHYEPKPLVIAERYHFHRRNQAAGEMIAQYVAELRRLSTHCEFDAYLDQALRDRLVCGLSNESIQKRLLAESDLTLKKAMDLALGMEAADRNAKSLKGPEAAVQKLVVRKPVSSAPCYRCGRTNHAAKDCRFKDAECHQCKKKGHIAAACRARPPPTSDRRGQRERQPNRRPRTQRTRWVAAGDRESGSSDNDELQLFAVCERSSRPFHTDVIVDGKMLRMEIDTGAAVSIISQSQQEALFPDATLRKPRVKLTTYTGEPMTVVGELDAQVQYGQQSKALPLTVVAGNGASLLGRNWLQHLRLDWNTIGAIAIESNAEGLNQLLSNYTTLFSDELGTLQPFKAKIQVRPDAPPRFFKPRSVPYAIKEAIEQELERLEADGIIEKVPHSEWAAPIVAVPKKDGKFRICGDYKVTVNQALEIDQYPLPKPEDLFATLAGGKKFTKLDLSQAYQQLVLEDDSRKYLTINTHRGLYCYTRLPFGVASAPAMFQQVMDTILQGIPNVICYIDDILVTGSDDAAHLSHLAEVLQRLEKHGVRMKKSKCKFMETAVEYLGHRVDAEGLHTTTEKLEAITKAPAPKNVRELRSFLGLLNYYGKFLPNLATLLHPLNRLLQKDRKWKWSAECDQAFQSAKDALTSSKVLVHYDPALPLKLAADASAYGVGAVISHVLSDGTERPIAFASRTLSPSETNYAQLEKEALALIFGIKKFHQYLYGRHFVLVTDHKPLMAILGPKKGIPSLSAARLQRWALLLAAYNYDIEFKPTQSHGNADGLSRLPLQSKGSSEYSQEASIFNICQIEALPVTSKAVQQATRKNLLLSKVLHHTKRGWPDQVSDAMKPFLSRQHELSVEDDCLLWGMRVVIPKMLQAQMLKELHRDHPGTTRMKVLARAHFWWPGLDKDIEVLAKSCQQCQSVKQAPPAAPLHPWTWPSKPWTQVHVDFAGPFLDKMYFIAVDAHSKWPEVFVMSQTTTANTIAVLRRLFASYGLPEQIVSDNGPQFTSAEFVAFTQTNGVKHLRCSPYHPSSNGLAERFVRTFKQTMAAGKHDGQTLQHRLANFLLSYRTTPHATTGVAPCTLFLGRSIRTRFDLLKPNLESSVAGKQAQQKSQHDKHARQREVSIGEKVMVKNLRPGPTWIPGTVTKQLGPVTFSITTDDGQVWKRHIDHIKALGDQTMQPAPAEPDKGGSEFMDISSESTTQQPIAPSSADAESNATQAAAVATSSTSRYPTRNRHPPDRLM